MNKSELKTLDKYTQFTQPYPNQIEQDLELNQFPTFTDIELTNPSKEQLLLRGEEAKRFNIILDNNNTSYEDKNIKKILSNDIKKTNRMDDIYDIELPDCFMRSAVVKLNNSNKKNNNENIKEEKNEEINIKKEKGEYNIDSFNTGYGVKKEKEKKEEFEIERYEDFDIDIDIDNSYEKNEINIDEKSKSENNDEYNKFIEDKNQKYNLDKNYGIIDLEEYMGLEESEGELNKSKENKNGNIIKNKKKNKIKEEETQIKSEWYNKEIIDIAEPIKEEKNKIKKEDESKTAPEQRERDNKKYKEDNQKKQIKSLNNKYNMTTLNIIGEKPSENYIGQIIEKGHNYPSNLGIVKIMDLEEFSENYFGEKLIFEEIAMKDNDFEKIIKIIPLGNQKYLFNNENASKAEIYKEENDIIILHGKVGQEIFYYIMKLTGQINRSSEYTIFKVKNNKRTIRHFKDSIGIIEEGGIDNSDITIVEGINYGIIEKPGVDYYTMSGQLFLSKYRKLIKREKETEEKKKDFEEKDKFNKNFENYFSELKNRNYNLIREKELEIEKKMEEIERKKNYLNHLKQEEKNHDELYNKVEHDKTLKYGIEERLKINIVNNKTKKFSKEKANKSVEKKIKEKKAKYRGKEFNEDMKIMEKNEKDLDKKEKDIKLLNSKIYCCLCHKNKREIIYGDCCHLMFCQKCFNEHSEKKGEKIKSICLVCKKLNKRFYKILYE